MRYFLIYLLFLFPSVLFADEPRSALDNAPSVDDSARIAPVFPAIPKSSLDDQGDEAPPVVDSAQESYVYDLKKLIIKSRENIKRVNDKIKEQAVVKRNQKREERAREYYERGLQLQDEGKLDEAREYFDKAIRITEHPEMTKYIQASAIKLKVQESALRRGEKERLRDKEASEQAHAQEARQSYDEAVRLYREKKYKEAKDQFDHVEELIPDYKATRSYLKIIDQDIIKSEALEQKGQKKEMEKQQQEAEEARQREKDEWKKEIDRKEKERNQQVSGQSQHVYEEAVRLYKAKKFAEAKKKFQQVEWVIPDYKATRDYLIRVEKDIGQEEKHVAGEKSKELVKQRWDEEVEKRKKEAHDQKGIEEEARAQKAQLEEQAIFLYSAAQSLFDKKNYEDALEKFNDIEKMLPRFKSTRAYIIKVNQILGRKPQVWVEQTYGNMPSPVIQEQQKKEAEDILELSKKSAQMYAKIASLANDRRMEPAKRKMEQVEAVLKNLKQKKEKILRLIQAEEERKRQRQEQEERQAALLRVQTSYDDAILLLRDQKFEEAKQKFQEIETASSNFKSTRQYLTRIDQDKEKAEQDAVLERTHAEEKRLQDLEVKQKIEEKARRAVEEDRLKKLRQAQEMEIQSLAEKAAILNDEILKASKQNDFQSAKSRFDDLEKVLTSLQEIKKNISEQEGQQKVHAPAEIQATPKEDQQKKEQAEVISEDDRAKQIELSNKRKKYLGQKYKKEIAIKEKQAREEELSKRKALSRDSLKRRELTLKEENKKEEALKEKRDRQIAFEKERRSKDDARRKLMLEQKAVLEKRRYDDERRRQELRRKQETLESERHAIQQRLMDGVKDMYQGAMNDYKQGKYLVAINKFQDVEDIMPNYKQTRGFLAKARQEMLKPKTTEELSIVRTAPIAVPSSSNFNPSDRGSAIQKTLDIFDPNAH